VPTGKETNTDAVLGTLKAFDISISRLIAFCASTESPYRLLCIILEWTGHGVPWFAIIIYFILGLKSGNTSGMYLLFNILFGLLLDVACVGTIKTIVKRPRPKYNQSHDMHGCVSADKYSFPSGHACRVVLMALLLLELLPGLTAPTIFLIKAWAFWVSLSRVMLGRHYLSDVTCGALLAFAIFFAMQKWLFLSDATCRMLFSYVPKLKIFQ